MKFLPPQWHFLNVTIETVFNSSHLHFRLFLVVINFLAQLFYFTQIYTDL